MNEGASAANFFKIDYYCSKDYGYELLNRGAGHYRCSFHEACL